MIKNIIGHKFGRLTVIEPTFLRVQGGVLWRAKCDCGKYTFVRSCLLIRGTTKSCGCLNGELRYKHGHRKGYTSREYRTWESMKNRCLNSADKRYKDYGGRGITVCERWMNFRSFFFDMGERPKGKTIERKNNDGNYEPSNCCWATPKEQAQNRRPRKRGVEV